MDVRSGQRNQAFSNLCGVDTAKEHVTDASGMRVFYQQVWSMPIPNDMAKVWAAMS
jgi:hypothetical protein